MGSGRVARFGPDYAYPPHYQRVHQFYLVFAGQVLYEADGEHLTLERGEGLFLAPGCLRNPRSGGGSGEYCVVSFNASRPDFLPRGFLRVKLDAASRPHAEAYREAMCENTDGGIVQLLFARLCLALAPELISSPKAAASGSGERDGQLVTAVERLMAANLGNPLPFETLCRLIHHSPAAVGRAFRRHLGQPPMERYRRLRLAKARELLQSGRSVTEAAFAAGFSSSQHLATLFRRYFRESPSRVMKNCTR